MNFFSNIIDSVKAKTAELQEKKEFLMLVEEETKPIRRAAYLEQKKADAINEGKMIAKKDMEKKLQKTGMGKKTTEDFGIAKGMVDPYKFLHSQEAKKNSQIIKSKKKKK